jgi:hypothetical protein
MLSCLTFLLQVFRYKLNGSCRMEPGRTQRMLLWTFCMTHSTRVISNRFPDRFACGQIWPPNSSDLKPCDYFIWEFFPKNPQTIIKLRALIIEVCNEMTEDTCRRVINNTTVHVEGVARFNGGHIEQRINLHAMIFHFVC